MLAVELRASTLEMARALGQSERTFSASPLPLPSHDIAGMNINSTSSNLYCTVLLDDCYLLNLTMSG
jgi:hypothetical protein